METKDDLFWSRVIFNQHNEKEEQKIIALDNAQMACVIFA